MCLEINESVTKWVLDGEWPRTFWKVLKWDFVLKQFRSPYYRDAAWGPGITRSSRGDLLLQPSESHYVNEGIHVHLEECCVDYCDSDEVAVKVVCQKEDFVAAGRSDDAVFTKVEILDTEWQRIQSLVPSLCEPCDGWDDDEDYGDDDDDYDDDDDWEDYDDDEWE